MNDTIYYISVNSQATEKLLKSQNLSINLEHYIDFQSDYTNIGIDRVFASYFIDNGIIIDAGSAITIDIKENKRHIGGYILPGLKRLFETYPDISDRLPLINEYNYISDTIPNNTKDAIFYGIFDMIKSFIENLSQNKNIYLTGGDGKTLSNIINNSTYIPNLIFDSMEYIAKKVEKC
jgi:type III pantothenate kinase